MSWLVGIALRFYYRKIHLIGHEKIPKNRPLLIASNHPTGFIEPCIKACLFERKLHFLTRGDIFDKPLLRAFLTATHQIPVFRFRDGFERLKENQKNLNTVNKVFSNKGALVVYVEGQTTTDRKLYPFQKGMARMTRDAMKNEQSQDIGILPIAVTFSDSNLFRSSVTMKIFDVIEPKEFDLLNEKEFAREAKKLTKKVHDAVLQGMFHQEERSLDQKFNFYLDKMLYEKFPSYQPQVDAEDKMLRRGLSLMSKIESLPEDLEIKDRLWQANMSFLERFLYYFLAPFALFGYLINFFPNRMAKNFAAKNVKRPGFIAPIIIAMNVAYYVGYILLILIFGLLLSPWILLLIPLLFIFGHAYVYHYDLREKKRMHAFQATLNDETLAKFDNIKKQL